MQLKLIRASRLLILSLLLYGKAFGCTGISLPLSSGSTINGRTVEFAAPLDLNATFVPQNLTFYGTLNQGGGFEYSSRYAAIGISTFDDDQLLDGINEKGLSVGSFYFPGFASYTPLTKENQKSALSPVDFPNYLLTQCGTLEEVKEATNKVVVVPTVYKSWGNITPPFHYIVYDKEGNSLVIEPIDGRLVIHENPFGVITNSPNFEWHLLNLRNYVHLSPEDASSIKIDGVTLAPYGMGSGLLGVPGDFTPPSRFVRAFFYVKSAIVPKDSKEGILEIFHILNQFDIPKGAVRRGDEMDHTLMVTVKDPSELCYYFRTYDNPTVKRIDLKQLIRNNKQVKKVTTKGFATIENISSSLQ